MCRSATDAFQFVNHPGFDLVAEFIKVDIESFDFPFIVAEDVDRESSQLLGQLDINALTSDGQGNLVWFQIDIGLQLFAVYVHAGNFRRRKRPLQQQLNIIGPVDYVNVFIFQLPYDTMDTTAFHAYAGPNGIDP